MFNFNVTPGYKSKKIDLYYYVPVLQRDGGIVPQLREGSTRLPEGVSFSSHKKQQMVNAMRQDMSSYLRTIRKYYEKKDTKKVAAKAFIY